MNSKHSESTRAIGIVLLGWLLLAQACLAAPDGPYVLPTASGDWQAWSVEMRGAALRKHVKSVKVGEVLTIPAVGSFPAFEVTLREPASLAADTVRAGKRVPLFVVADTHGEFEILAELLQKQDIVSSNLRWTFGNGHLLILGDVFDRGPNQLEILWLLYQLESEARRAGGGVHLLLGNHEAMVMQGDLRFLNPKYVQAAKVLGVKSYTELFNAQTLLGQWLRCKPAVIKINDYLALHGGIARTLVDRKLSLADINDTVRAVLAGGDAEQEPAKLLMGQLGPLWYRGYFDSSGSSRATPEDVDVIRQYFNVSAIIVGHTRVPTLTALYERKVIAVQVYPERRDGVPVMEALRIQDGKLHRARIDGTREPL